MCRFALYLGPDIPIASLVTEPANSIIHQSFHSHLREEPLNGDGFGLAWYPSREAPLPFLKRSARPGATSTSGNSPGSHAPAPSSLTYARQPLASLCISSTAIPFDIKR